MQTNALGEAYLDFTDTESETITILAILTSDAHVYQTVSSTFSGGSVSQYTLEASATGSALANGIDTNTVTATLLNNDSSASGELLKFTIITGSALFTNGTRTEQVRTGAQGEVSVDFTDTSPEEVLVMVTAEADSSVYKTVSSAFLPGTTLEVERIYNDNDRDFDIETNGPNHLFIGAKFYIKLSVIDQSIVWSCEDSNVSVKNVNGLGHVTINDTPSFDIITLSFSHATGKGNYDIACNIYLDNIHADWSGEDLFPSEKIYKDIFGEWGDLSTFEWGEGNSIAYCYDGSGIDGSRCVDMSNGKSVIIRAGDGAINYATMAQLKSAKK